MADKTTAPVPPPPAAKRQSFLGKLAEAPTMAADNMKSETEVDMGFKVKRSFRNRFKTTAASNDLSMKELLEASFEAWIEKQKAK
jgi:hypothetical protein